MRAFVGLLRLVVVAVIIVGAYVGYRVWFGAKLGEPCPDDSHCADMLHAACLRDPSGNYCTHPCTAPSDCPSGWTCASTHDLDSRVETQRLCSRATGQVVPVGTPRRR